MPKKKLIIIPFRRKKQKRTNYKKRRLLLLAGKSRLVVRKSSRNIVAQIVEYEAKGDKIITSAQGIELKKLGWNLSISNIPAAYLTGLLIGKKAQEKKVKELLLDIGLQTSAKGGRLYALVKGAIDAGLDLGMDGEIFPTEDRLNGSHITTYAEKATGNQFTKTKNNVKDISKQFDAIKKKILER